MSSFTSNVVLTGLCVLLFAQGAHAFGAGELNFTSLERLYLTLNRKHRIYLYCRGCQLYVNPAINLRHSFELHMPSPQTPKSTHSCGKLKDSRLTYSGRHGDIEDALLAIVMARAAGGKKFDKMNVARVYFVSTSTSAYSLLY